MEQWYVGWPFHSPGSRYHQKYPSCSSWCWRQSLLALVAWWEVYLQIRILFFKGRGRTRPREDTISSWNPAVEKIMVAANSEQGKEPCMESLPWLIAHKTKPAAANDNLKSYLWSVRKASWNYITCNVDVPKIGWSLDRFWTMGFLPKQKFYGLQRTALIGDTGTEESGAVLNDGVVGLDSEESSSPQ